MLWVCIYCPDLPLEALAPPLDTPAAVYQQSGNRKLLLVTNTLATQRGLQPGMGLPSAQGLVPELCVLERKPEAERAALEGAACWAYRFGSPVTLDAGAHALWVEVGHSLKLFGGWRALALQMKSPEGAPPYRKHWGVAPTRACAFLLARINADFRRGVQQVDQIPQTVGPLPLDLLPLVPAHIEVFRGAGLRRIGEVLAIPHDALGRRIGKDALLSLDRLLGRAPELFEAYQLPARYRRAFEFSDPVENVEAMLFPIKMMLGEFCRYLYTRDASVQEFALQLIDSRKRVSTHPIGLMSPTRHPARLLLVLREKLDQIELRDGVLEIVLLAERFEEATALQDDLFGSAQAVGQRYTELRERLAARLGQEAVRQIAVSADLRPEAAITEPGKSLVPGTHHPPRPLWLLPEPRPITPKRLLSPPERLELGWFEGEAIPRDYYLAQDQRDRVCWVYRNPKGEFLLHGYWQ